MQAKIRLEYKKKQLIVYILLTLVILAVYWPVSNFDFVHIDDNIYVTENTQIKSGINLNAIRWAFGTTYAEFWHPLTWLSLMFDYQLHGLHAGGYHATNLVLHILSTLLLFRLFCHMTGEIWKSAFVAACFALHPLHVENAAWVAERKDVLSAFFWMLTLSLYVYYTEKQSVKRYLPVLFSFILALLSKPMVVTLPVVMILLDYWPLKRFEPQKDNLFLWQLKEKLPFFVLSVVFSIITVCAQHKAGGRDLHFTLISRFANALVSLMTYLEKTLWPRDLAVFYPFPDKIPALQSVVAALLIIAITAIAIAAMKRSPYLFAGWGWFTISIAPVIGIVPIGDFAMADRYHYIPSIGIAVIFAWGIPLLIKGEQTRKNILFPLGIIFLTVMASLTWKQCGYWKNDVALFNHTLQVTKNNYLAHINLGYVLDKEGKTREAIDHYNKADQIMPNNIMIYNNRGNAYAGSGQSDLAMQDFNEAIRLNPDYADAYFSRATLYQQLGRYQQALEDLTKVIQLNPAKPSSYFNRGNVYIKLGLYPQAIEDFSKSIRLQPDYIDAYNNRAFAYLTQGRYGQAIDDYTKAIDLKPDYADAYNNRAFVHLNLGDIVSGCRDAQKACELGNCATAQVAQSKGLCR